MKVAILAGGMGTRLAEETENRPKPMVEIGGRPILWHIMRHYDHYGFGQFVVALGYKGDHIRRYFTDYHLHTRNLTIDLTTGATTAAGESAAEQWVVELIETGHDTHTGGRISRLAPHLGSERFMLTWGDGVSDVDLRSLLDFHKSHGKIATVTAVHPPPRLGQARVDGDRVVTVTDEPLRDAWINGAFFVLEPEVFDYVDDDSGPWEGTPIERLVKDSQLMAYRHDGFWQCMDTMREKVYLEGLWRDGTAPWKVWA